VDVVEGGALERRGRAGGRAGGHARC
jgi:hypothetical protein